MKTLALVAIIAVAGCSSDAKPAIDDALWIDCVGSWNGKDQRLWFHGNHPDYAPDDGYLHRGSEEERFRYHLAGHRMRLWMKYGRELAEVGFALEQQEEEYVRHFVLRFDAPVFGQKVYTGYIAKSYRCEPRDQ
jgi:hypothetical protein